MNAGRIRACRWRAIWSAPGLDADGFPESNDAADERLYVWNVEED